MYDFIHLQNFDGSKVNYTKHSTIWTTLVFVAFVMVLGLSHNPATTFTTTFRSQAVVSSSGTACHCGYSDEHVFEVQS